MALFANGSFQFEGGVNIHVTVDSSLAHSYLSPSAFLARSNSSVSQWHEDTIVFASAHGPFRTTLPLQVADLSTIFDVTLGRDWLVAFQGFINHAVPTTPSVRGVNNVITAAYATQYPYGINDSYENTFEHVLHDSLYFNPDTSMTLLQLMCVAHNIQCDHNVMSYVESLLHHFFYGLCVRNCCFDVGNNVFTCTSLAEYNINIFLSMLRDGSCSHKQTINLCKLAGIRLQPESATETSETQILQCERYLLQHIFRRESIVSHDIAKSLNESISMPRRELLRVCGLHGMELSRSVNEQRVAYILHVIKGKCWLNRDSALCALNLETLYPPPSDVINTSMQVVCNVYTYLNLRPLELVASMFSLDVSERKPALLRKRIREYLYSSTDQNESLRRSLLSTARSGGIAVTALNRVRNLWPQVLSDQVRERCLADFITETSSDTLQTKVCACCSERVSSHSIQVTNIGDIDIDLLRRPEFDHDNGDIEDASMRSEWLHSQVIEPILPFRTGLLSNILVDKLGVVIVDDSPVALRLCDSCNNSLRKSCMPRLAIANRLFLGDVPLELQNLTPIEESMISLCRAKCMIVHLRGGVGNISQDTSALPTDQRGMRGHIIIHPQQIAVVAELLPPPIKDIIAPVCVIFVGSNPPSNEWICKHAKPLAVRVDVVRQALVWLQQHNYLYRNIQINDSVLNEIAECNFLPFHVEHMESSSVAPTSNYVMHSATAGVETDDVPFDSVYITDVDGHASANQLRAAAVSHVRDKGGGFIELPHNQKPENEFYNSHLFPKMYPSLFPYGIGGFEDNRRDVQLSMQSQIKHFLNISDRRFERHHSFIFTAFNILQRRTVLMNTSLKTKQASFPNLAEGLNGVLPDDIHNVSERIVKGDYSTAYSDGEKKVLRLMKEVDVVNRDVPCSNASRVQMRNEIRALIVEKGVPGFFITINPADVYNPVVKLLAGNEIDIDDLLPEDVPKFWDQSVLIAKDPAIASRFFKAYMDAFVKTVLGFDKNCNQIKEGVLGIVKAYYGCVEAQGRGSLHCHMLVWLEGHLDPNTLKSKLLLNGKERFQARMLSYLEDTIESCIPFFSDDIVDKAVHPCALRPPVQTVNETDDNFLSRRERDLHDLVKSCQTHVHNPTCFKYWKGDPQPKECRFEMDAANTTLSSSVDSDTGDILLKNLDGMVNNFNRAMIEAVRCNMDIKFIGSGYAAKAVLYYITDYISKSQMKTHVAYATLELAVKKLAHEDDHNNCKSDDITVTAKRLLRKCANSLIGLQELSAQQVTSYLMGFDDHYTSHSFKNLYWPMFVRHVVSNGVPPTESNDINNQDVYVSIARDGNLTCSSSQMNDYIYRGNALHSLNLWDFIAQIDKVHVSSTSKSFQSVVDRWENIDVLTNMNGSKFPFQPVHAQYNTHFLRIRQPNCRFVPVFIGPTMPRYAVEDEKQSFCRLMLILFKPWSSSQSLTCGRVDNDWVTDYEHWFNSLECTYDVKEIITNIFLLRDCADSRDHHMRNRGCRISQTINSTQHDGSQTVVADFSTDTDIWEESLNELLKDINGTRSVHADVSEANINNVVEYATTAGFFEKQNIILDLQNASVVNVQYNDLQHELTWKEHYDQRKIDWKKNQTTFVAAHGHTGLDKDVHDFTASIHSNVSTLHNIVNEDTSLPLPRVNTGRVPVVCTNNQHVSDSVGVQWTLNIEQLQAFQIVTNVSQDFNAEPLKMLISGAAGTGKSRIVSALREYFSLVNQQRRFRICSFMGIAAKNILGMTLHAALCMGHTSIRRSAVALSNLMAMWEGVDFLFVDEISMISCEFLCRISEALSAAKGNTEPFGGIHIIFAGDLAQLPPVGETRLHAKFDTNVLSGTTRGQQKIMGKQLWLSVDTVIELHTVVRQCGAHNAPFLSLLNRLRYGQCTNADYDLLNTREISSLNKDDLKQWQFEPVIVTENATKDAVNERMAAAYAASTNQELQWYHASDFVDNVAIMDATLRKTLGDMHSGKTQQRLGKIPLVLGMPVMVTSNIDVEGGVANGSRGRVQTIRYKERNGLRFLTSCVVKLDVPFIEIMPHTGMGDAPLMPDSTMLNFKHPYTHQSINVKRVQVPIVPAFCITAHRAQGQTATLITVDLQSCRGTESPYVMLSRVQSLDGLVILRPFEKKKISCAMSQDARDEFQRLQTVIQSTQEKFKFANLSHVNEESYIDNEIESVPRLTKRSADLVNLQCDLATAETKRRRLANDRPNTGTVVERLLVRSSNQTAPV